MRNIMQLWPRTNRTYLLTGKMEANYSFSVLFLFFFGSELSNIDGPGYQVVFTSWLCNPLRKSGNHVAWWDATNHIIMQRDMKLQQMQISTSSSLLRFSTRNSLGLYPKTVSRVGPPVVPSSATMHHSQSLWLIWDQFCPQQNLLTMEQIVTVEETQIKDKKCILLRIKGGKQFVLQCEVGP